MLSPVFVSGVIATIFVGLVYDRIPGHFLLMLAMLCFCVSSILLATMPIDQTYWGQEFVATIVAPFGGDISFPAATLVVSNTMPIEQQGVAASMVTTAINWSIAFGLGIAGTVTTSLLEKQHTYLEGLRGGFYVAIGLSGAAVIIALVFCRVPAAAKMNEEKKGLENGDAPTSSSAAIIDMGVAQGQGGEFPFTQRF
jgi:MFS family permease